MLSQIIALYNWSHGVIMIAIFGVVCLVLVGILIKFMATSDRHNDEPTSQRKNKQ